MKLLKKIQRIKFCKNNKKFLSNKPKNPSEPLNFFDNLLFNKKEDKINLIINEKYFRKFGNKFNIDKKIQLFKIKNYPLINFNIALQEFYFKQHKIILNLENFCSLNFFLRYGIIENVYLNQIFIKNHLSILLNFTNLTIIKKIEIILLLDYYGYSSENLMTNLINNLNESILKKEFKNEIIFYYDFFSILHFFSSILTRYTKNDNIEKINNILNPEFLNGIYLKIIEEKDIIENELFLNFISEQLEEEDRNYLFDQFLKSIYFKM